MKFILEAGLHDHLPVYIYIFVMSTFVEIYDNSFIWNWKKKNSSNICTFTSTTLKNVWFMKITGGKGAKDQS